MERKQNGLKATKETESNMCFSKPCGKKAEAADRVGAGWYTKGFSLVIINNHTNDKAVDQLGLVLQGSKGAPYISSMSIFPRYSPNLFKFVSCFLFWYGHDLLVKNKNKYL